MLDDIDHTIFFTVGTSEIFYILTFKTLWAKSAILEHFLFSVFPRKHDLTFYAKCLHNLETIYMKCQILFSGKK